MLELSKRFDELAAKVASPDDDVQKHRGPIEVLIANQKALQDAVISSQKALQDAVISSLSSQKALQEALAAQSQQRNCGCNIC